LFDLEKITCGFAIVRNPFQRFLSFYHWSNFKLAEKRSSDAPEQVVNFDDWAEYTIAHYNDRSTTNGKLIRPQHLYVGPKLQTAFKLEAGLETIFSGLFNALGLHFPQPLHMPKRNVSKDVVPEEFKHPAASTQTIQSIVDLYQKDFELFGYDPNDHPFT
ncbi:MAG: sulfotransferase family protein, partial [Rickettsiales bacterium]|nr:sulfotransferase family protein [Rickettsiales bacterium]